MRLTEKQLEVARLCVATVYASGKNNETVSLETVLDAYQLAGVDKGTNPFHGLSGDDFKAIIAALTPPDPGKQIADALDTLGKVRQSMKEAGIGQQPNPLRGEQEGQAAGGEEEGEREAGGRRPTKGGGPEYAD